MTVSTGVPTLFTPIKVGNALLQHRIVLAPLTRFRADDKHVHTELPIKYYEQRASTPGTLLISEGTFITPQAGGYPNVPGIWNEEQIAAWTKVTEAVHAKGGFIFMQLWALGRAANAAVLEQEGPYDVVSASAIQLDAEHATPRPLTVEEIKEWVQSYAQAAKNAVRAGFDGVEIHSANGYLLDQFIQTNSNERTDEYGGSIENRIRFVSEVTDAVTDAIGPERTGIRFSPWSPFQGMRMSDPKPTFSAIAKHLVARHPKLAYIHAVEPRDNGITAIAELAEGESNDFIRDIWSPRPLILAGGFTRELALAATERDKSVLIGMGRYYISNPDLPKRWLQDIALTPYDRDFFYSKGAEGYTDYAFSPDLKL
ncbi:NADH:flavin oxidoreductase/NADH oxidase [Peniophora sp. CONT]|nr:NADH:flavin oxidoreductase/NADH oxidase [Peniophora sp. CONT]